MAKPRWSMSGPSPASMGTPEAAAAPERERQGQSVSGWTMPGPGGPGVNWATLTGQNLEGRHNAFDTDFWEAHTRQYEEQRERGLRGRFTRADATGVATYNDPTEGVAFGDVFLDGKKQGNIYAGYAGLQESDADQMMARLVLPREVWAAALEADSGRAATMSGGLRAEIERAERENTERYAKGLSAEAFEADVRERAEGFEESGVAHAANIGGGAAGGALIGGTIGSFFGPGVGTAVGAGIGALVGGVGAWLNRDEQFTRAAQAMEQYELARDAGATHVGMADAVSGWVGVLGGNISPVRNLTRGIYDAMGEGGAGDQSSRWNDEGAPAAWQVIDTAGLVVDGIGSFGSRAAVKAYTAIMGATAASSMYSVGASAANDTIGFDPYSGTYRELGVGGVAARAGSAGIDFVQTAMGRGVSNMLSRGKAATEVGGHRIVTGADGVRRAQRMGFTMFVPSEAATGLTARMLARRSVRQQGLEATRENLAVATARHIDNLTTGRRTIATMMVNAVGEGSEEFVQATLDALSVGEIPTFTELVEAYRQGAAMGAGMGFAIGRNQRTRSQQLKAVSDLRRTMRGEQVLTEEQWEKLSDQHRALEGTISEASEAALIQMTVKEIERLGGSVAMASVPEMQRAWAAVQRRVEAEARNSQEIVEPSSMSTRSNFEWAPQDAVMSLTAAMRAVAMRGEMFSRVARGETMRRSDGTLVTYDEETQRLAGQMVEADRALLSRMEAARAAINEAGSPDVVTAELNAINAELREMWSRSEETDPAARRAASVLAARYPLNSSGSFQLLRLQVSPQLTMDGADNVTLMPDEVQPMMGGDYDGDMVNNMLRLVLPAESYAALRHGAGQLASDHAMMSAKPYVVYGAELMWRALSSDPTSPEYAAARAAVADIKNRLRAILSQSSMDARDVTRVVDEFAVKMSNRQVEKAYADMFRELPTRYAVQMRDLAQTLDESPWLLLNRAVEDGIREMGTAIALTDMNAVSSTGAVVLPRAADTVSGYRRTRPTPAASELATGAIQTSSWDIFRLQTILKYNALREQTELTEEEQAQAIQTLIERFVALNDGLVRSGDEAMFETSIAQERSIDWLEQIAQDYRREIDATTAGEALVLVAGMRVPDVDLGRSRAGSGATVTLAQAVLHEVLNGLRREYSTLLGRNDALAMRLESLDALTRPDHHEGTHMVANGGRAFVELLGATPIVELLGEHASHLQSFTVRGLRDTLIELRSDVREEFVDALQNHPQYRQTLDGEGLPHTPYRVLVDAVVEAARMELHETAEGRAGGVMARANELASENFKTMHDSLRALANTAGHAWKTPADVRAMLTSRPDLAVQVLAVMEDRGLAAGMVARREDGSIAQIHFPQWLYEVLAEPSTARAEMMLLRNTLIFARAALSQMHGRVGEDRIDASKVSDRILALWLDLDHRANDVTNERMVLDRIARDDFLRLLGESNSVAAFESGLNTDYRFRPERSAPYMAWVRDIEEVMADRFGNGVSTVRDGQELRDALRDAAEASARELQIQEATERYLKGNAELLDTIRASRDEGLDPEPWRRFQVWFNQARELPNLISMAVVIEQAAHINEILSGMGVKGQAPSNVAALGRMIAAQLPTFDSALGRLFASVTSGSVNSVLTDMTQLTRGPRTFVMNDGTVVNWDGIDASTALDMLGDPKHAGMVARMIGLTAWDLNSETGIASLTSALDQGVAGLAMDPTTALFDSTQTAKFRRLMLLEGRSTVPGGPPMLPVHLALQMNLRETSVTHVIDPQTSERQRMAVSILEDMADAFQALATLEDVYADENGLLTVVTDEVTGERIPLLNKVLLDAGRRARRTSGNVVARMIPNEDGPLRSAALSTVQAFLARLSRKAYESQDAATLALAAELKTQYDLVDSWTSPVHLLVDRFKHFDTAPVQQQIVTMLRGWGDVANTVAWARPEILKAIDPNFPQVERALIERTDTGTQATSVSLPNLTTQEWETLARAVIAFTMHVSYGPATSSDIQIAQFPSLSDVDELNAQIGYWDPSGVSVVMDMLAPGIMENPAAAPSPLLREQMEMVRELRPEIDPATIEDATEAVYRLFEPAIVGDTKRSGVVGQWHALLPALMHSAVGAVMSSAAETGISMVGKNPQRLRMFGATTPMDWSQVPPAEELSTVQLDAALLVQTMEQDAALDTAVPMQVALAGGPTELTEPIAHLSGRIARSVVLTLPDGTEVNLLGHARFGPGLMLPASTGVPAGEGGVLVLETLANAVSGVLADSGVPLDAWSQAQLTVQFFHPRTKAVSVTRTDGADYSHNAWFDGVAGETDAAFSSRSLMGFLYYGLDGMIPQGYDRALGAIKKLHFALQQVTTMPEVHRRALLAQGLTDMPGMIDAITSFMMKQRIDGEAIPVSNYNALRKFVELMYVVRYVDADGNGRVLSADAVTAMQQRGEEFAPDSLAEVVGLPLEHVLALMGEKDLADARFTVTGMQDYTLDLSRAKPYTHFPAEAWTPQMFGGFVAVERNEEGRPVGWATTRLQDYAPLQNMALPRSSTRYFDRQPGAVARDPYGRWRELQDKEHAHRATLPDARVRFATQKARVRFEAAVLQGANPVGRTLHGLQKNIEGQYVEAAVFKAGPMALQNSSHDLSTGWLYRHQGVRMGSRFEGILVSASELENNGVLGDTLTILADDFLVSGTERTDQVFPQAREVLDVAINRGLTIHLPASATAGPLVSRMRQYLRERGFASKPDAPDEFVPAEAEVRSQTTAAYHSMLSAATYRSSRNRVLVDLSDENQINENALYSVNGGIGALENYFVREVVQTARYAGYAPPVRRTQDLEVIASLRPVLRSAEGRRYLHAMAETKTAEEIKDLDNAIDGLLARMDRVEADSSASLLPQNGEEFGTGDLVPLVSFNARGELVGVHLLRHGHEPVREEAIRGPVSRENQALGVRGARLTIDRAKVDDQHTTHRGTLVSSRWVGLQGFVARVRVNLSDLGSKVFEAGTGMKWTTTPPPSTLYIPSKPLFAGKAVTGAGDLNSPSSKNSDQSWLNAPDRVIEVAGFDVMPYLVRALHGTEPDAADYSERASSVRTLLREFAEQHGGSLRPQDVVRRTSALSTELVAQLSQQLSRLREGPEVNLQDDSTESRLADVTMLRLVLTALTTGARLEETLSSPGYIGTEGVTHSHTMHPVFTTLLAQLPASHPAKAAYVEQINARLAPTRDGGDGYYLNADATTWTRRMTRPDGLVEQVQTMLAFPEMRNTDHNDALAEMAVERRGRGTVSATTLAMAHIAWGADSLIDESKMRASEMFDPNPMLHGSEAQIAQQTFNIGAGKSPFVTRSDDDLPLSELERKHIETEALPAAQALAVEIDDSGWYEDMPKAKARAARQEFDRTFRRVQDLLRLQDSERIHLVEMIRAAVVRPASLQRDEGEFLTRREAMAALRLIEENARQGLWPLHRASINAISRPALEALYRANYPLRAGNGSNRVLTNWDQWIDVMLAEVFTDDPTVRRYPATTNIIDGLLYGYRKDVRGLRATANPQLQALFNTIMTSGGLIVSSPILRLRMDHPGVQAGRQVFEADRYETSDIMLDVLPQDARAIVEKRMAAWEARNDMGTFRRQSPRAEAKAGHKVREDLARTNAALRLAELAYVGKTMLNMGLHVASYLELGQRAGQETMVSFLSGQSLRWQQFTPEQRKLWIQARDELATNREFYSMIYSHISWNNNSEAVTRLEKLLQRGVNFAAALVNDPTWGTRPKGMANAFMEAVWDTLQKSDAQVSPEQFLDLVRTSPSALSELNADAVNYGFSRIEYRRNLQDNLAEQMRRKMVEGFINSRIPGAQVLGTILGRFPTMFFRFRSNTLINLTGLQLPHALLTTLLSDRTKRPGGLKDRLTGADQGMDPEVSAQARVEDSLDLTRAFIRTGVSHAQLFMLAGMISAMGFGGDGGEEERLLNKLRRYQSAPSSNDPMSLESDFRNADAWFIDLLPGGVGVPSWIMRMFVSPAMGVARFHETGDFRQVYWGFFDALGNMPLLNLDSVMSSWNVALELQAAAEAEALADGVEANVRAMRGMTTIIGTLENMLFESAFASMLYQASDEWDRDPYAIPDRDGTGTILRDRVYGTPLPTDALQDIQEGERFGRQGYVGRNDMDAILRGLAENRPMLAWALRLIKQDETYLRSNMVPKMRTTRAAELTVDEGEQLIMSILNNETGAEELTIDGAEAVVRGIHLGTVRADSPALQGVFLTREQRMEIQRRVLEDLTEQYLDLGFAKGKALSLAKEAFYGQAFGEPEALGFADILWDTSIIPQYQNQRYMQLNTTYVMGPNGRPVATGIQRNVLAAFGLTPIEGFHAGQTSNMPVDDLLNSVDAVRGQNLGLRALVKVDETWEAPKPEELARDIEKALEEIGDRLDDAIDPIGRGYGSGWRNFSRGRYSRGGGGYSGSSYVPGYGGMALRLDPQRRVRMAGTDDLYSINTSNPIIRRADIRRERFASQRGRLNQWQ